MKDGHLYHSQFPPSRGLDQLHVRVHLRFVFEFFLSLPFTICVYLVHYLQALGTTDKGTQIRIRNGYRNWLGHRRGDFRGKGESSGSNLGKFNQRPPRSPAHEAGNLTSNVSSRFGPL